MLFAGSLCFYPPLFFFSRFSGWVGGGGGGDFRVSWELVENAASLSHHHRQQSGPGDWAQESALGRSFPGGQEAGGLQAMPGNTDQGHSLSPGPTLVLELMPLVWEALSPSGPGA